MLTKIKSASSVDIFVNIIDILAVAGPQGLETIEGACKRRKAVVVVRKNGSPISIFLCLTFAFIFSSGFICPFALTRVHRNV